MEARMKAVPPDKVSLLGGPFKDRFELNRRYVMSLTAENLLQNYHIEARLRSHRLRNTTNGRPDRGDGMHWGWESPTCQLRGHFTGHWMSAAARIFASTGDAEVKARLDKVVGELGRCQEANGGEWAGPIPESYLHWTAKGKPTWAPHYVVHKTLMGLYDAYAFAGSERALEIMERWARWFHRWTGGLSRGEMDDILDVETGGMLEAWADLYGATGREEHLDLVRRYDRPRLFEPLLAGEDVLTNRHANTTIPEAQGAARAYEVTGEERWREVALAYWRSAVTDRGCFCTGGQTTGEVWTPPHEMASRLGTTNQELCTVYNMMRLADYLHRWTGDAAYADYIERNALNGILAQQNPRTGMPAYFLPLMPGARKVWGSPTYDFWCCHGALVQAHSRHDAYVYYEDAAPAGGVPGLTISQYVPTELRCGSAFGEATVRLTIDREASETHRPMRLAVDVRVKCEKPTEFALRLRFPWWLAGKAAVLVNGEAEDVSAGPSEYHVIGRTWGDDSVRVSLPKTLTSCALPDEPESVAFMDGPVVLAGLCDGERALQGDPDRPESIIVPDNEREWGLWLSRWRARGQEAGLRLRPLHEIVDERYTVYFPVRKRRI